MSWIWQQPGWPDFTWNQAELAPLEARFRDDAGRRIGAWRRLGEDERIELRVGWLSDEAAETSAIEGELLDRDSVQSSIRRQFGLAHDQRPASPAEAGVAEMMVSVYREFVCIHPFEDLAALVAKGALRRTGARRYTRYWLDLPSFGE